MTSVGSRGFTLLEMLVALAALGLLALLLGGSVQFGARAWEGQTRRLEAAAETDAVHTVLRTMLRNLQPQPLADAGGPEGRRDAGPWQDTGTQARQDTGAQAGRDGSRDIRQDAGGQARPEGGAQELRRYVAGRPRALDFVGELPEAFGRGGLYDIGLLLSPDGRLMMRWRPHVRPGGAAPVPAYDETELLRNVAAFEISYYAAPGDKRPEGWQSDWTQAQALPALIRLRLRFAAGDRRVWRDLVVAPVIGGQTG